MARNLPVSPCIPRGFKRRNHLLNLNVWLLNLKLQVHCLAGATATVAMEVISNGNQWGTSRCDAYPKASLGNCLKQGLQDLKLAARIVSQL